MDCIDLNREGQNGRLQTLADFDTITSRDVESRLTDLAVDGNVAASISIRAADRGKMPQACPAELHVSR
ncbi:hypothetical protein SH449x_004787 [Pirellulaceae bacterium SH449]